MIYVIGSGPAGVACSLGLLKQGLQVTMLDAGLRLEDWRRELVAELGRLPHEAWPPEQLERLRADDVTDDKGVPKKHIYGSDFAYRRVDELVPTEERNTRLWATLAKGGFSNLWGASMLPYRSSDTTSWPVSADEMEPHYREVLSHLDLSAVVDDLAELFPLYTEPGQALEPSRQAQKMLSHMTEHRDALQRQGIRFGRSRLAVTVGARGDRHGCVYCGLCLHGCPYELIYNSAHTLESTLLGHPDFRYLPGVFVERLDERSGRVTIHGRHMDDARPFEVEGERVYVATGVRPTTRLLLHSLGAYERPVSILESQYFLLPALLLSGIPGVSEEALHTISQLYLEIEDASISPNTIHLQLYTYNDMMGQAVATRLGPLHRPLKPLSDFVLGRMLVIQGYLHSSSSPSIEARLSGSADGGLGVLHLEKRPGRVDTRRVLRKLTGKLFRHGRKLDMLPLTPFLVEGLPGQSTHSGGSFPMRSQPAELESDRWGRPAGLDRVHLVDASVFPEIPATTVTLSVMANAHRIASAHRELA